MNNFDFSVYAKFLKKWLWLLVVAAVVAGGAVYMYFGQRDTLYEARTLISIGGFLRSPNPEFNDLRIGEELVQTYAVLALTDTLLQATIDTLQLPTTVAQLRKNVSAEIVQGTSLLEIVVEYPDPALAASIANELSTQLLLNSPADIIPELEAQITLGQSQIEILSAQLESLLVDLNAVNERLNAAQSSDEIAILTEQRTLLVEQINDTTATIAQFSGNITDIAQRSNSVEIFERAQVPENPIPTNQLIFSLLAAAGAASVVAGILLLYEASKPVLRSPQQAEYLLGTSVRGNLHYMNGNGRNGHSYEKALIADLPLNSSKLDRYHMLRANLNYKANKNGEGVYMLTSSEESTNPGVVATNLAIANARSGLDVLLIDADLRNPRVHTLLGVENRAGLVDMLRIPAEDLANQTVTDNILKKVIQTSSVDCLSVITAGEMVDNPAQLSESGLMDKWLRILRNSHRFDVVLMVTPSVLSYSDTTALAATTSASILLVVKCEKTNTEDALKAKEQILHVGGTLEGIVVI